jgi:predicted N-acetyltransferase YhbS
MSPTKEYLGPKTTRPDQLKDVIALSASVFRGANVGDLIAKHYPLLYHPDRLEQLRIFEYEGRPVALVGMIVSDTVLLGCDVRVARIGSVCTTNEHRGNRLASRLLQDAEQRAISARAPIMLISGGRSLYTRRGAASCGRFHAYEIPRKTLPPRDRTLTVTQLTRENAATALRLFEAEPIRFRRTAQDYAAKIATNWIENRPGASYLISRAETPVAAISVSRRPISREDPREILRVCEMAGSRRAILPALPEILDNLGIETAVICAYPSDRAMLDACAELNVSPQVTGFQGTVKVLDVDMLWRDFTPLLIERIGPEACAKMNLTAESDEFKIHTLTFDSGGEHVTIEGEREILLALFGSPELDPLGERSGALVETLRRALPLPLPMYGASYI